MRKVPWLILLSQQWIPFAAVAALLFGCFHPIWELMLPKIAPGYAKSAYAFYLTLSFLLLRRCSPRHDVHSSGWWCVDVMLCTYTIVPLLQLTLRLPRPDGSPINVFYGSPSGHSVAVFALAWIIHEAHPRWSLPWFAVAVIIALTRIDSLYHFPYQVIGGAALGMVLGWWICHHPPGLMVPQLHKLFEPYCTQRFTDFIAGPARAGWKGTSRCSGQTVKHPMTAFV